MKVVSLTDLESRRYAQSLVRLIKHIGDEDDSILSKGDVINAASRIIAAHILALQKQSKEQEND